ncbi:hypothetical protein BHE90_014960 [Fusarium euwallaceae]|uniref:Uncharacterized protein n=1 Tax=Fusarium euwallaceae TaxID=1147111 RepID=A0A430L4G4_9HYPO|nr:hypothetical protein BHE90_014960 [Fusarium euwallaceae]
MRLVRKNALKSLIVPGPLILGFAAGLGAVPIPWISMLNIPTLSYGLYEAVKLAAAWKYEQKLETVVEQATNWELEEDNKSEI